jgi:transcriptional regulator with XRE-family HTH domain
MYWTSVGAFLKDRRRSLPRDTQFLGRYVRLPARRGRAVTQEELAEAIGVTRVWYAMLESGAAVNTSPRLVARLADALQLSVEQRKVLFDLALPYLSSRNTLTLTQQLARSITPLRTASRRLWSATTESEILLVVAEAMTSIFDDSDMVGAQRRLLPGEWAFPIVIGDDHLQSSIADMVGDLLSGMTAAEIDETMLHGILTEPGQVGTRRELHSNLSRKRRVDQTFATHGFGTTTFIDAHIRGRTGDGTTVFAVYANGKKDFTELDRAVFGTLADLASLALG